MGAMSDIYHQLLDATIQHLENLQSRGVRHVAVSPETLRALAQLARQKSEIRSQKSELAGENAPQSLSSQKEPELKTENLKLETPLAAATGETTPNPEPPLDPQAKSAAFAALRERALACMKCPHLASSRKTVVFGVGNIDAQLMFVGEAPGADEDEQGEPFVGQGRPVAHQNHRDHGTSARRTFTSATF